MLAFPEMLMEPARQAGIAVPDVAQVKDFTWDTAQYPHWTVFCSLQLEASLPHPSAHWDNAEIVASVPDEKIEEITPRELFDMGFSIGQPVP